MKHKKWIYMLGGVLLFGVAWYWFWWIHMKKVANSERLLGSLSAPCLPSGVTINIYQSNEWFDSAQGLYYTVNRGTHEILPLWCFGGTADFDRKNAQDFTLACSDSMVYIMFEKSDTMASIYLDFSNNVR